MRKTKPKDGQRCDLTVYNDAGNLEFRAGYKFSAESDGWFKPIFERDAFGRDKLTGQMFVERTTFVGKINPRLAKWAPSPPPEPSNRTQSNDH
jgi:hypothetical protein